MPFRAAALLILIVGTTVEASEQSAGRVTGRVVDQTGASLPGVVIDLVAKSRELTTTSDETGAYRFEDVPSGNAELTYRLLNFSLVRRTVVIASGADTRADAVQEGTVLRRRG
jgi:hypothetical protein